MFIFEFVRNAAVWVWDFFLNIFGFLFGWIF